MPNQAVVRRKQKMGGLHIELRAGDRFIIHHEGETLQLQCNGKTGSNKFSFSILGPRSFDIRRWHHDRDNAQYSNFGS